jgi:hypothetical protein
MTSDGENGLLRVKFRINLCIGLGSNLRSWFSRPVAYAQHEAEVEKRALVRLDPEADVQRGITTSVEGQQQGLQGCALHALTKPRRREYQETCTRDAPARHRRPMQ